LTGALHCGQVTVTVVGEQNWTSCEGAWRAAPALLYFNPIQPNAYHSHIDGFWPVFATLMQRGLLAHLGVPSSLVRTGVPAESRPMD
jgi:hypothetical protein